MIEVRSDSNARTFFSIRMLRRLVSLSLVFAVASVVAAKAETKNVKIMMDWIIQGTHAPYFVALDKGYFKSEGVTVDTLDAGKGATNVAVSVAGGAYQFGWVDLPTMIKFNAQNPASPLLAVYVSFEDGYHRVVTRIDEDRRHADPRIPAAANWHASYIDAITFAFSRTRHRKFFDIWPHQVGAYDVPTDTDMG